MELTNVNQLASFFARPGIIELDGDNILLGKVKAGIMFEDEGRTHVEIPGIFYASFSDRVQAVCVLADKAKSLIPLVRDNAVYAFHETHPYLTQLLEIF